MKKDYTKKLLLAAVMMFTITMFTGCEEELVEPIDAERSSMNRAKSKIISIDNGLTLMVNESVLIETDIPYPDDIVVVRFWINDGNSNKVAFTDNQEPFEFNWKPSSAGSYKLWIKARDKDGNPIVSEKINVTVNDDTEARITFPSYGSKFNLGDNILIETDFKDLDDIEVVRFWINDGNSSDVAFTTNDQPFEFNWKPKSAGTYKLWVKARDKDNNPIVSEKIVVVINDNGGEGGEEEEEEEEEDILKPHSVLKVPVCPNSGKKHKPTQIFTIKATAKMGEWEILALGGSGGDLDSKEIKDIEDQGFEYLGGGGSGDKNAHVFYRKMSSSSRDIKVNRFANHTMFIYDSKSDSELSKYGIDIDKNGSTESHHGNYSSGVNLEGLSAVTTDDGVKKVECGSADVLAADDSHHGDGLFLIYGKGKFEAERNDKKGGKQLQYFSFTN